MPGHKRAGWGRLPEDVYRIDITEIDDFDNLHQPEGILLELQQEASRLYGAEESFYLINGSTGGILAAVSCAVPVGGHLLMARNCHKSAYHAAYLRNLTLSYLEPPLLNEYDVFDAIEPEQIEMALEREPDIGAVLLVSPTYEGRISDIHAISDIVHKRGIPLIVDEAHGAHLGLPGVSCPNSCQSGADLVIHSVHKTLPSLTQTALLHRNGTLVEPDLLKRFLHIYQSSSPSYLLMASIDNALQYAELDGRKAFPQFEKRFENMMQKLSECRHLKFLTGPPSRQDTGKLLVSVKHTDLTGRQLYEMLLKKYWLQTEMASESFVLAMFTVNDGEEAYVRMTEALLEIDNDLGEKNIDMVQTAPTEPEAASHSRETQKSMGRQRVPKLIGQERTRDALPLSVAWDAPAEEIALENSVGRYVGEFVNLYPPGIPLLVPGERMTGELCRKIVNDVEQKLTVQGISIQEGTDILEKRIRIKVLRE